MSEQQAENKSDQIKESTEITVENARELSDKLINMGGGDARMPNGEHTYRFKHERWEITNGQPDSKRNWRTKNSPRDGVDDIISVTKIKDNPFEEDESKKAIKGKLWVH